MDDQSNHPSRPQSAKRPKINSDAVLPEASVSVSARQFTQGGKPGLSSAPAVTESNLDFNFDSGDAFLSTPQQRGMDASSGALTGFNANVDEPREFSFVELVQQDNFDLPGDDFSNFNETFQDPGIDDFGIEPSPTDVGSEAAAFCAPQQALSSALHGGPFEDVAEPGPQQKFLDVNLDACISTALMSLPSMVPKPIWEEGVWSAIFGNGILIKTDFCELDLCKPAQAPFVDSWIEQIASCSRALKQSVSVTACDSYSDVVKHMTDQTWEEERESLLQIALKRWMMVVTSFQQTTVVWMQLAAEGDDLKKLTVLADVFRGKAPGTLLKRVRAIEKICYHLGPGNFPCSEETIYRFFQFERDHGAPPSRLKSYLEALAFCLYTFSMEELKPVVTSKRLHGCSIPAVPMAVVQASPLTVEELTKLHAVLWTQGDWNSVFAGAVLFVVYARARWADAMHSSQLYPDRDDTGVTRYLEAAASVHKTMHANLYRHRLLPLVAPAVGVVEEPWVDRWFTVRDALGIKPPPLHALMPAPASDGGATKRPLSATEAGAWLRKLLHGTKEQLKERRLSAHSLKATTLSYAAKFGLSAETRLQLAYHVGGFKMLHTYSRDAAAQPLLELERVLHAIRDGSFRPDSTRSGRFLAESGKPSTSEALVVDLTDPKPEVLSEGEEAQSSSSDESSEEFPKANSRVFKPPEPPAGYVFWQHRKMKTLHLTRPDYKRVFMCNRYIGPLHSKEDMSIRYDTPVCRQCAAAVKE